MIKSFKYEGEESLLNNLQYIYLYEVVKSALDQARRA
jgi:hypothetical protein